MTQWQFQSTMAADNQHSLNRLIRAIAFGRGQFALILVRCNYSGLRLSMLENLRAVTKDVYLREIFLEASTESLHNTIINDLHLENSAVASDKKPDAVIVFGLESVANIEELIVNINQARDIYIENFPFPLVLWLTEEVAACLSRHAPDFKSWAATTIKFEMTKEDLINLVQNRTKSVFSNFSESQDNRFLYQTPDNLSSTDESKREVYNARNDLLRLYDNKLSPELDASLEFVLGRDSYIADQIEDALAHFQRSLALLQPKSTVKGSSYLILGSTLNTATIMIQLGLCYRRMADKRPAMSKSYIVEALFWFKQSLEIISVIEREDLVARFITLVCDMLYRLENWSELYEWAQKSQKLHSAYGYKGAIARDCAFLAAVAGAESDWLLSCDLAQQALSISEQEPEQSRSTECWYLLLLGRAQRHLGEWEEAINNLEWAKVVCELQYEPALYLSILEELRELYFFERHNYTEAFQLKQEKIQIEHQYGYRAFIGASQLQPQRQTINSYNYTSFSGLLNNSQTHKFTFAREEIAKEIAASGRQNDVNRLIERITRADCKLTIIHGPSGVGKSSILRAGLVPALQSQPIGERLGMPILLGAYADWVTALGRSFNQVMTEVDLAVNLEITPALLLENIRLLTELNYTVILIFDQFEEFFFTKKHHLRQKQFYEFFSQCLNLPFVKVILSIREDYLHYLLEFERLGIENNNSAYNLSVINQNILDKDIRYYLGNFSVQDAISVIDVLTQNSHYELTNELINQLVQDLASDVDEVHPIELQIVGAQLQAEKITTLLKYTESGGSQQLVLRWLSEVIKDCGRENEHICWKLLFELTDEKGTRPLKSLSELAAALAANLDSPFNFDNTGELILDILVQGGLLLRIRDTNNDRYQLVHDYLVEPIRQKNNYGIVAELEKIRFEKTKAEVAVAFSQEQLTQVLQRRLREARIAGAVLAIMSVSIGGLWWQAETQRRTAISQTARAERSETNLRVSSIAAASETLFASNKQFDALIESLRAFRRLKNSSDVQPDTRMRVVTALQQAVEGVQEKNRLEGHSDILWSVTWSPDGKILASGSRDQTVKIWGSDGRLLQTLKAHSDAVTGLSFSPDGQTLASVALDRTVVIWRRNPNTGLFLENPTKIVSAHDDYILSVSFSPDGKYLATAGKDDTAKIWDARDMQLVTSLNGHKGWVHYATWSPDSQFIATASEDKAIKLWRPDGTLYQTLQGHQSAVTVIAWSPDAQTLATAGKDKTVRFWQNKGDNQNPDFKLSQSGQKHTSTIWSLDFSHDGAILVSGSDDNTVNIWNTRDGSLQDTLKGHSDAVVSVAVSPDGQTLASASYDKSVKLWSLNPPSVPVLQGHADRVLSIAWSPDGNLLVSGGRDRKVVLWQKQVVNGSTTARALKTLEEHTERISSVSFSPDAQTFASASYDKTIKIWRRDGSYVLTLRGHNDAVMNVAFSPDGKFLASASKDQTIKIWNNQGRLLKTLVGHTGWVNSLSFSHDSQLLASASDDKTVKLWRMGTGRPLQSFLSHESWVLGVTWSPTDNLLASAGWDNTVKLWRPDGTLFKTLLKGYSDSVNSVTFSPGGEILAAAGYDSTVKLWSREGKLIKILNAHQGPVSSAKFSPDGQTLASGSFDHSIILWNLNLDNLMKRGCNWVRNFLKNNRNLEGRDRTLCENS